MTLPNDERGGEKRRRKKKLANFNSFCNIVVCIRSTREKKKINSLPKRRFFFLGI